MNKLVDLQEEALFQKREVQPNDEHLEIPSSEKPSLLDGTVVLGKLCFMLLGRYTRYPGNIEH